MYGVHGTGAGAGRASTGLVRWGELAGGTPLDAFSDSVHDGRTWGGGEYCCPFCK